MHPPLIAPSIFHSFYTQLHEYIQRFSTRCSGYENAYCKLRSFAGKKKPSMQTSNTDTLMHMYLKNEFSLKSDRFIDVKPRSTQWKEFPGINEFPVTL